MRVCTFLSLLFFSTSLFAQQKQPDRGVDSLNLQRLNIAKEIGLSFSEVLKLDESQKNKIVDVNIALQNQKNKLNKTVTNKQDLIEGIKSIENQRDDLYKPILSAGQFEQYLKIKRQVINTVYIENSKKNTKIKPK